MDVTIDADCKYTSIVVHGYTARLRASKLDRLELIASGTFIALSIDKLPAVSISKFCFCRIPPVAMELVA